LLAWITHLINISSAQLSLHLIFIALKLIQDKSNSS
jgi:hypothetical protein